MLLYLRKLSLEDGYDVFSMLKSIGLSENAFTNPVHNMDYNEFRGWLLERYNWDLSKDLPENYVRQTIYWLYLNDIPIGIGKIRYALTEESKLFGGNIGYAIAPDYRGKGYGNEILRLLLEKVKESKISETLITVEKYNYPSKAIVEKNGGYLLGENDIRWFFTFDL